MSRREDQIEACIELCDEIKEIDSTLGVAAADFAESVMQKVKGIREWIETNDRATEAQYASLVRMRDGMLKWKRGKR